MQGDDTEALLESALSNAFSPPPSRRQSAIINPEPPAPEPESAATEPVNEPITSPDSTDNSWKDDYDEQVKVWRVQSAEARAKAEQTRGRWEAIRADEKSQGIHPEPGWENVSQSFTSTAASQHAEGLRPSPGPNTASHSRSDTGEDKWEDIPSGTSSYPSLTFPDNADPHHTPKETIPVPQSVTLSIFDSSLSTGVRVRALLSSIAINFALPFVNGVMLGFGEIFAKNVVLGWLGWKNVSSATTVGLRQSRSR